MKLFTTFKIWNEELNRSNQRKIGFIAGGITVDKKKYLEVLEQTENREKSTIFYSTEDLSDVIQDNHYYFMVNGEKATCEKEIYNLVCRTEFDIMNGIKNGYKLFHIASPLTNTLDTMKKISDIYGVKFIRELNVSSGGKKYLDPDFSTPEGVKDYEEIFFGGILHSSSEKTFDMNSCALQYYNKKSNLASNYNRIIVGVYSQYGEEGVPLYVLGDQYNRLTQICGAKCFSCNKCERIMQAWKIKEGGES